MSVLGLIGTGKIGSAIITGYCSENGWSPEHVYISTRSESKAKKLKDAFPSKISVEESNQAIVDQSDVIFVGLLPHVAREQLPKLTFTEGKKVVSMMATIPYDELLDLVSLPRENVIRTVPLPSTSKREGPILAYPHNEEMFDLLSHVGTPVMVDEEKQIITLTGMTAMISFFYATCGKMQDWCESNGVAPKPSRDFVAAFFKSLANAGFDSNESFIDMAEEAATPGGLNEQTHRGLIESGAYELMVDEVDLIYKRLTGSEPAERRCKRQKTT